MVITQIEPISVIFTIAEDQVPVVSGKMHAGQRLRVEAYDRTMKIRLAEGSLTTLDNQIDQATGTLRLRATFNNKNEALFPNQFVNARLLVAEKQGVTLVPTATVQRNSQTTYVYVVNSDSTVTVRNVTTGTTEGDQTEITSGLAPGEVVVMTGVDKLQEGSKVNAHIDGRRQPEGICVEMSPSRTFILRPVATSLLMAGILLAGIVAYKQLPVSALPEVDYPTIQVITFYPGASPDVMASSVTAPLERQFGQVPGLQQMTSTSSDGSSVITLQFNLDLNIDVAEQEVQRRSTPREPILPPDLPTPPIYSKTNPADAPILTLALTSKTLPLSQVEDLADTRLAPKISQLPGVGLVSISGGQKPAVRIQANPTALAAYGLIWKTCALRSPQPTSTRRKEISMARTRPITIGANDQLLSSDDYSAARSSLIGMARPVKLTDVANVIDDVENVARPPG